MVNKNWRPLNLVEDLGVPTSIANLISICWHEDPTERPDFKEIQEYLTNDCMREVMGTVDGTGQRRRTSTTGMRVQRRILAAQANREEKIKKENEEELKAAVKNALEDGGISQEISSKMTYLVGLFKDMEGNIDEEDVREATKLIECMKLGYPQEDGSGDKGDEAKEESMMMIIDSLKEKLEARKEWRKNK